MTTAGSVPACSIVVATRNRGATLVPLVESVLAGTFSDFELVIVDQSLDDATEHALAPFLADDRLRYVRSTQTGLGRARNTGAAVTRAPVIAITDDDCIVPPDWLEAITRPFDEDPRVGVVFCTVCAVPVDAPGHTPQIEFTTTTTLTDLRAACAAARHGLPLGAGMAVRRATFDDVHGFDELLGAGARFGSIEDSDLSWRGLLHGWSTVHSATPVVVHDGFRDLEAMRELVIRDFYGVGGAVAKYVRARKWPVLWFFLSWLVRFGIVLPAQDVLAGRRPTGFRRPMMLARGFVDGLRTPFDRATLLYESGALASP